LRKALNKVISSISDGKSLSGTGSRFLTSFERTKEAFEMTKAAILQSSLIEIIHL